MNRGCIIAIAGLALATAGRAQAPQDRPVPYWASISAGEAMMRTGPGRQFPGIWLYRRAGLPVKVVQVAPGWRRVQDQDGAVGWMLATLLTDKRTVVMTGTVRAIHADPDGASPVRWQAEPGVIGRIRSCAAGWCRIVIGNRTGHVRATDVWGVEPGEQVED